MRLRFSLLGVDVHLSVRRRPRIDWDKIRAGIEAGEMIVCSSRCLWCGRQTPHETCHAHATELGFDPDALDCTCKLWDSGQEPETCDDPACPVWEPSEAAALTACHAAQAVGEE